MKCWEHCYLNALNCTALHFSPSKLLITPSHSLDQDETIPKTTTNIQNKMKKIKTKPKRYKIKHKKRK